ncbi:MAG: AbrB/MazE/SpoVT family DNA-binding domain-containing protein [Thermodesulfobacteriota bacterium]|nr:AbrB/MazE/SpoVT family DNA-binding domain-containing protein [Thermodesulfobacteriota bacterium]
MLTTKLSSKGQVIIPQLLRTSHHWRAGMNFTVIDTEEGVLLKPQKILAETRLDEVAGCLKYQGKAKTLKEMDNAIKKGIKETFK